MWVCCETVGAFLRFLLTILQEWLGMRIKEIRLDEGSQLCYVTLGIEDKEDIKMLDGLKIGDIITQIQAVGRQK